MIEICSFGCNQQAKFKFKNGKYCCSKNQNSCVGVKNKIGKANKLIKAQKIDINKLCDYGCGKKANFIFKNGKYCCSNLLCLCEKIREKNSLKLKGRITWNNSLKNCFSEESLNKLRKIGNLNKRKSKKEREQIRQRMIGTHYGKLQSLESRQKKRINMLNGQAFYLNSLPRDPKKLKKETIRKRNQLLNGQSLKMIKCIKKISNEEIKLRNMVKELYQNCEFQYPIFRYSLDVAIPEYKIAIEYDGYYHFDTEEHIEYYKNRRNRIENKGWYLISYNKIPTIEKLKEDIKKWII